MNAFVSSPIGNGHRARRIAVAIVLMHGYRYPTHEEALARYVDHFRERRDWRGLIDLSEFALDNMIAAAFDCARITEPPLISRKH